MSKYYDKCELGSFDLVSDVVLDTKSGEIQWKPGFVDGIYVIHRGSYIGHDDVQTTFELRLDPELARLIITNNNNQYCHTEIVSAYDGSIVDEPIVNEFRNLLALIVEQR